MLWMLPLITGAAGAMKANENNRARKAQNEAAVAQTRYSSWSGMGPGQIDTRNDNPLLGAVSGAVGGLGAMQGLGGAEGIGSMLGLGGAQNVAQPALDASYLGSLATQPMNPQSQFGVLGQQYSPLSRSTWNIG